MIDLDNARKLVGTGPDSEPVARITRGCLKEMIAEIEDGRRAAAALSRCGDTFGLPGVKL